jgi:hypothetical protein
MKLIAIILNIVLLGLTAILLIFQARPFKLFGWLFCTVTLVCPIVNLIALKKKTRRQGDNIE